MLGGLGMRLDQSSAGKNIPYFLIRCQPPIVTAQLEALSKTPLRLVISVHGT